MTSIVSLVTVLLITLGSTLAAPRSNFLPKAKVKSVQREKDVSLKTVSCDLPSKEDFDRFRWVEENTVKLALYEAVTSRRGIVKAKKACASIEGDPLPIYATAKGGKLKIIQDYSQNRWLRFTGLIKLLRLKSYTTRKVEVGYFDQGNFIPLNGAPPNGRRLFLRLKGKEYF